MTPWLLLYTIICVLCYLISYINAHCSRKVCVCGCCRCCGAIHYFILANIERKSCCWLILLFFYSSIFVECFQVCVCVCVLRQELPLLQLNLQQCTLFQLSCAGERSIRSSELKISGKEEQWIKMNKSEYECVILYADTHTHTFSKRNGKENNGTRVFDLIKWLDRIK